MQAARIHAGGEALDATPFFAIHHYYQNKAAKRAGEEIVVLPFAGVGLAIYATGIVPTDKMIREKPDLTRRFVAAVAETFTWRATTRTRPARSTSSASPKSPTTTAWAACGRS